MICKTEGEDEARGRAINRRLRSVLTKVCCDDYFLLGHEPIVTVNLTISIFKMTVLVIKI